MSKVTTRDLLAIGGLLERLDALTEDTPSPVYADGDIEIHHEDGWLIGIAVFEDDQWWVDFTNYGSEMPPRSGSQEGSDA